MCHWLWWLQIWHVFFLFTYCVYELPCVWSTDYSPKCFLLQKIHKKFLKYICSPLAYFFLMVVPYSGTQQEIVITSSKMKFITLLDFPHNSVICTFWYLSLIYEFAVIYSVFSSFLYFQRVFKRFIKRYR